MAYRILKSHDEQGQDIYRVLGPQTEANWNYDADTVIDDVDGLLDALSVVVQHTGPHANFRVHVSKQ